VHTGTVHKIPFPEAILNGAEVFPSVGYHQVLPGSRLGCSGHFPWCHQLEPRAAAAGAGTRPELLLPAPCGVPPSEGPMPCRRAAACSLSPVPAARTAKAGPEPRPPPGTPARSTTRCQPVKPGATSSRGDLVLRLAGLAGKQTTGSYRRGRRKFSWEQVQGQGIKRLEPEVKHTPHPRASPICPCPSGTAVTASRLPALPAGCPRRGDSLYRACCVPVLTDILCR